MFAVRGSLDVIKGASRDGGVSFLGPRGLGAQRANPVYAARYQRLTTREDNKLTPAQAQTVITAAILRHLQAVITTGQAWDPAIATHGTQHTPQPLAA